MTTTEVLNSTNMQLAQLYIERGDLSNAVTYLQRAKELLLSDRNWREFNKCVNGLIRCYAELEMHDEINALKDHLQDLALKESLELNSNTYYTLGVCAVYKGQSDSALEYFQKSLNLAMANNNKEDIAKAIYGTARTYIHPSLQKYSESLKELEKVDVFLEVCDLPEVKYSSLALKALIYSRTNRFEEALSILWDAYEVAKNLKNVVYMGYLLIGLADTYHLLGETELSRTYIKLAERNIDQRNKAQLRVYDDVAKKIGKTDTENVFDLIFDEEAQTVTEKKLGKVDFKNQFILLDLLKLFVEKQGEVFSKEYLAEAVWKQSYEPLAHDNKIYVTIKRLRKMIEPDYNKAKYIFRAKDGYFMNKTVKVSYQPTAQKYN